MKFPSIPRYNSQAATEAALRQNLLAKPRSSLGRLEDISIQLAGITGKTHLRLERKAVIVMASDHGAAIEGGSINSSEVTRKLVLNILHGGAATNVLARQMGARVVLVDIGVASDFKNVPGLLHRKVAHGTANCTRGPAMTPAQAEQALQTGLDVINGEIESGLDLVAIGEMGIGGSCSSAAITAVFSGLPVKAVTGRGNSMDDRNFQHKVDMIQQALVVNEPDASDAMGVLFKVGGFEIAGLAGAMIGAAAKKVPVVIDGFISGAAALIAVGLVPQVKFSLIASHQSAEVGHIAILKLLGLSPIFDLGLYLGEGCGAVLALPLIQASASILNEMATFTETGVIDSER